MEKVYTDLIFSSTLAKPTIAHQCITKGCESTQFSIRTHQTRSSDEPVTIYITCNKCKQVEVQA